MGKIKLIIFIYSLGGGGIQKFLLNLVKGMDKEKFDVKIALVKKDGVHLNELPENVGLIDLNVKKVYYSLFPLVKILIREKPDILFCIGTNLNLVGIVAKIISRSNTKLIIRQAVMLNKLSTSKLRMFLVKLLYPKVDKCIALTEVMKNNITDNVKFNKNTLEVIYNSINIKEIEDKKNENVDDFFKEIKEPKIINVGRLTKQKNQLMLIEAFKLVLKEKKAKLIIIGEGEDQVKLQEKINEEGLKNEVLMLGFQKNPYKYVYNSEVFVLSSLYEGLSNSLLEALACEIPIVTTDNPDNIIKEGVNGLEAKVNSHDIANKICELLNENSNTEEIKKNNNRLKNQFDISKMVNKYEKVFEKSKRWEN